MTDGYPISLINGLRIQGDSIPDTKASRILSALLLKPNEVVDGESLIEAGWYDDRVAGGIEKIRGNRPRMLKYLANAGVESYELKARGGGSYELQIDPGQIDVFDILDRVERAAELQVDGSVVAAARELERIVPLFRSDIKSLGTIKPPADSIWADSVAEVAHLRVRCLQDYFLCVFEETDCELENLLRALSVTDLRTVPSPRLWEVRIGLAAELEGPSSASSALVDAKLLLNKMGERHEFDSLAVPEIRERVMARWVRGRAEKPAYDVPPLVSEQRLRTGDKDDIPPALVSAIRSDLVLERERLLSLKITGSSTLTLRDMDADPALQMPARATVRSGSLRTQPIDDLVDHLTTQLLTGSQQYLIVAPPGAGKSLVCRLVFLALTSKGMKVPALVDLRGESLERAEELVRDRDLVVMDSLDELLASGTFTQVRQAVQDTTLGRADVVACRTHFYEQFLTGTPFVEGRTILEIKAWDIPTIERYIDAYHRHVFSNDDLSAVDELKRRLESPSVESLLSIPLRLNMALDLIPPGENNLPLELNSLSLHRQWIEQTLRNEAARRGSVLDAVDKLEYLTTLAWRFYDEGTPGNQVAPTFTDGEIREVLGELLFGASKDEIRSAARDLELLSILVGAGQHGSGTTQFDSFEFMHKSYQEFLVARYIINAVKASPEAAASVFRQYLSPLVSDFIKDELKNASSAPGVATRLAQNLQGALANYDREAIRDSDSIRLRSTINQICYYLASIPLTPVRETMLNRLLHERDPLVARGIAIGLSFGGETRGLDQYIESLRLERQLGRATDRNDLNIGYHLSFFGDQPFDPLQPEIDRGLESVSSTVSRLIYQLSTETDFGSWRLDLYTLIDIYKNRSISKRSAESTIVENRDRLNWVLTHFKADARTREWPEVAELQEVLIDVGVCDG